MMIRTVVLFSLLNFSSSEQLSPPVVKLSQGILEGQLRSGYVSYEGIPYASAGIQERFKTAGPPPSWSGVRPSQPAECAATSAASDCLLLDVHSPTSRSGLQPVLAWIRGGPGDTYHPEALVRQGIVLVIVSHRLGIEGFLCTDDERIPGNAGLKDIVLALRWIRENIVMFRGNPAHVVVGGQSFGAAMAESLTLTTMSENLYRGVIMQSGSILSPWAFHYDAKNISITLGKSFSGTDYIYNLMKTNPKILMEKAKSIKLSYHSFGICEEHNIRAAEMLLTDTPYGLMCNDRVKAIDDVPMLVGFNNNEANTFLPAFQSDEVKEKIHSNPLILVPVELSSKNMTNQQRNQILEQLLKLYFTHNSSLSLKSLLALHRDAYFLNNIHRSVRLHAALSVFPVYYYQFSYSKNGFKNYGAGHSDELKFLFPRKNKVFKGSDEIVHKNLITLWSNFIRFLDPTPTKTLPKWEPLDPRRPRLYDISTILTMRDFPYEPQMKFWDELNDQLYYREAKTRKIGLARILSLYS